MLYQIDLFNGDITPPFANPAAILSALDPPDGTAPLMGSFIVRVDDSLPVQNPANLQDLLLKRRQALLASYAGSFSQMVYDDLLDPTDVDTTVSGPGTFGSRSSIKIDPVNAASSFLSASTGTSNNTTTFTASSVNFVTAGVVPGDSLVIASGPAAGTYTVVAPITATNLTVTSPIFSASAISFSLYHTAAFQSLSIPLSTGAFVTSTTGGSTGLTTFTDSSVNFSVMGVVPGDSLVIPAAGTYTVIAPVTATTLTVSSPIHAASPVSYQLFHAPPEWGVVTYQLFSVTQTDPVAGRLERTYMTLPPSSALCQVSFDGGTTWNVTTDGMPIYVPSASRGSTFKIRLSNGTSQPIWVESWALLYN